MVVITTRELSSQLSTPGFLLLDIRGTAAYNGWRLPGDQSVPKFGVEVDDWWKTTIGHGPHVVLTESAAILQPPLLPCLLGHDKPSNTQSVSLLFKNDVNDEFILL